MLQSPPLRSIPVGTLEESLHTTAEQVDVVVLLIDRASGRTVVLAGETNSALVAVHDADELRLLGAGAELRLAGRPRIVLDG
jgi:hypothetical protein